MIEATNAGAAWKGRARRMTDAEAARVAERWRETLGVRQAVRLERILPTQVTDHTGRCGCSLVGVSYDSDHARIYHTRALTLDDIVHELLHVAHPTWSEDAVVAETARRLMTARPNEI